MGDRANVAVKTPAGTVYLYTHWNGTELPETLRRALAKRWRWNDEAYLTRIIFCEMVKGSEADETGFGISSRPCDGQERTLIVDTATMTVEWRGTALSFDKYAALSEATWSSFSKARVS